MPSEKVKCLSILSFMLLKDVLKRLDKLFLQLSEFRRTFVHYACLPLLGQPCSNNPPAGGTKKN